MLDDWAFWFWEIRVLEASVMRVFFEGWNSKIDLKMEGWECSRTISRENVP